MKRVRDRALELVGNGYIYGAKGQVCSAAFRQGQAQQYPEQAGMILGVGAKWDGRPVWDCAQLARAVAAAGGVALVSGATSQWKKTAWARSGEVASLPADEVCFVFRREAGSASVMAHVGVSLGDGTCVHAKGTQAGVVREDIAAPKWTHWATPVWQPVEDGAEAVGVLQAQRGGTVNIRKEPGGELLDRVAIGTKVALLGAAADGWLRVRVGNVEGVVMSEFVAADEGAEAEGDMVTLALPKDAAEKLLQALMRHAWD